MGGASQIEDSAQRRRPWRHKKRLIVAAAGIVTVAVLAVAVAVVHSLLDPGSVDSDSAVLAVAFRSGPRCTPDPDMWSAKAAQVDPRLAPIAQTPQAKWFGDWSTAERVQDDIGRYLAGVGSTCRPSARWSTGFLSNRVVANGHPKVPAASRNTKTHTLRCHSIGRP